LVINNRNGATQLRITPLTLTPIKLAIRSNYYSRAVAIADALEQKQSHNFSIKDII